MSFNPLILNKVKKAGYKKHFPGRGKKAKRSRFDRLHRISKVASAELDAHPVYRHQSDQNVIVHATGTVRFLAKIRQFVGPNSANRRIGDSVRMIGLNCRGQMLASIEGIHNTASYAIVYDNMPCGTVPAYNDIFDRNGFIRDGEHERFQVLKRVDRMLIGNRNAPETEIADYTCCMGYFEKWYLPMDNYLIKWKKDAVQGEAEDCVQGALYLVVWGDYPLLGLFHPFVDLHFRLIWQNLV